MDESAEEFCKPLFPVGAKTKAAARVELLEGVV